MRFAMVGRTVGTEGNASSLEEVGRRNSARKNPNKIVGQFANLTANLNRQTADAELCGHGVEEHLDRPRTHLLFNTLCVAVFQTAELALTIGEGHLVPWLMRESHGGLDRAVSTANYKNVVVCVMVRLDEAVKHMRKFFALDAQFTRGACAPQGQHDSARPVLVSCSPHTKESIHLFLDRVYDLPCVDVQIGSLHDLFPECQYVLL